MNTAKEKFEVLLQNKALRMVDKKDPYDAEQLQFDAFGNLVCIWVNMEDNTFTSTYPDACLDTIFQWTEEEGMISLEPISFDYSIPIGPHLSHLTNRAMIEHMLQGKAIINPYDVTACVDPENASDTTGILMQLAEDGSIVNSYYDFDDKRYHLDQCGDACYGFEWTNSAVHVMDRVEILP